MVQPPPSQVSLFLCQKSYSHRIHVWYIYLHLADFYGIHVGKYTSPVDPKGLLMQLSVETFLTEFKTANMILSVFFDPPI